LGIVRTDFLTVGCSV